jgi:hypothetical protein
MLTMIPADTLYATLAITAVTYPLFRRAYRSNIRGIVAEIFSPVCYALAFSPFFALSVVITTMAVHV